MCCRCLAVLQVCQLEAEQVTLQLDSVSSILSPRQVSPLSSMFLDWILGPKFLREKRKTQVCEEETLRDSQQVIIETHSSQPCATARAQVPTNLQKPGTIFVHVVIFPALSVRQLADAMHIKCEHELPGVVPQHQLVCEMPHLSQDGGG